jgi:hypothetical protein
LNHPHIDTIYGFEDRPAVGHALEPRGQDSDRTCSTSVSCRDHRERHCRMNSWFGP